MRKPSRSWRRSNRPAHANVEQTMTTEEFRDIGHRVIDWIADYRARIADLPVTAQTAPGEVRLQLPALPPDEAESFDAILGDLERIILPGLSHWQHPGFF